MSVKTVLSISATTTTLAQFLTGIPICSRVRSQGDVGEVSGLPFVMGCVGCSVWLKYSLMIDDPAMILINSTGLFLQMFFLLYYYQFCLGAKSLSAVRYQLGGAVIALLLVLVVTDMAGEDESLQLHRLGCIGALASIGFTAAPLVSLRDVFRSKSTAALPLPMISVTFLVMLQWYAYGCLINDKFVQIPNLVGAFVSGFQLLLFVVYPRKKKATSSYQVQNA